MSVITMFRQLTRLAALRLAGFPLRILGGTYRFYSPYVDRKVLRHFLARFHREWFYRHTTISKVVLAAARVAFEENLVLGCWQGHGGRICSDLRCVKVRFGHRRHTFYSQFRPNKAIASNVPNAKADETTLPAESDFGQDGVPCSGHINFGSRPVVT